MVKIPFAPPDDPVLIARGQQYENSFDDYTLPMTISQIKKIVTHLSGLFPKHETPQIYLLDERIKSKNYGKRIGENLKDIGKINP